MHGTQEIISERAQEEEESITPITEEERESVSTQPPEVFQSVAFDKKLKDINEHYQAFELLNRPRKFIISQFIKIFFQLCINGLPPRQRTNNQ